jgi:Tol biopolymer transport system component
MMRRALLSLAATALVALLSGCDSSQNTDGTGRKELTETAGAESPERDVGLAQHVWSPNGNKTAFVKDRDLHVINADGTGQKRLTNTELLEDFPTWSPDGEKIAFTSERLGRARALYVINADGSDLTRLATDVGKTGAWGSE